MTRQGSVSPVPRKGRIRNRFWSNHLYQKHSEAPSNESAEMPSATGVLMVAGEQSGQGREERVL